MAGHGAKANITVTIDLDDLRAATADAIGRTVYSDGLSAATVRRLACDANVIPLVLGSNSEPLDVGRRERLVTRAMRRALNARDRGCVVCGAPPIMCDAHHLISWIDGGETKVDNLALLCRRHHTDLHAGHWQLTIRDGIVDVARPSWAEPSPTVFPAPHTPPLGVQPRRTTPPYAQRECAPLPEVQPRHTAPPYAQPGCVAPPEVQPRHTAPLDVQPGCAPPPEAQPPGGGEIIAARSRWRADETALKQAADFAATG